MSRYRKIDTRIWNDEQLVDASPLGRLAWFAFLTHPTMTPMGAGVLHPSVLDEILGRADGYCWACGSDQEETSCAHSARHILSWFESRGRILRDRNLIVVKNFLLYNAPESPHTLAGWLGACEELPRSPVFATLRDHLRDAGAIPEYVFKGLLDPLAAGQHRNLSSLYWERIGRDKPNTWRAIDGTSKKGRPRKAPRKAPNDTLFKGSNDTPNDGPNEGSNDTPYDGPNEAPNEGANGSPNKTRRNGSMSPGTGTGTGTGTEITPSGAGADPEIPPYQGRTTIPSLVRSYRELMGVNPSDTDFGRVGAMVRNFGIDRVEQAFVTHRAAIEMADHPMQYWYGLCDPNRRTKVRRRNGAQTASEILADGGIIQ